MTPPWTSSHKRGAALLYTNELLIQAEEMFKKKIGLNDDDAGTAARGGKKLKRLWKYCFLGPLSILVKQVGRAKMRQ